MFSFCVPGHEFEDKSYFTEAAFTGDEIRYEGEKTVNTVQRTADILLLLKSAESRQVSGGLPDRTFPVHS